jgi:hypothetical protein
MDYTQLAREALARQNAQRAQLAATVTSAVSAASTSGQALVIGQRVLDRLTGLVGTLAGTFVQSVGVPAPIFKYLVRFANSTQAGRTPDQLSTELPAASPVVPAAPVRVFKSLTSGPTLAAEEAALEATERSVGYQTTAQALASGNPGLPQPGSLAYADFKQRGVL